MTMVVFLTITVLCICFSILLYKTNIESFESKVLKGITHHEVKEVIPPQDAKTIEKPKTLNTGHISDYHEYEGYDETLEEHIEEKIEKKIEKKIPPLQETPYYQEYDAIIPKKENKAKVEIINKLDHRLKEEKLIKKQILNENFDKENLEYQLQNRKKKEKHVQNKLKEKRKLELKDLKPNANLPSPYGYVYMPNRLWRQNMYKPPVCQPSTSTIVQPVYVNNSTSDLLEYTGVGSILPQFQYIETPGELMEKELFDKLNLESQERSESDLYLGTE